MATFFTTKEPSALIGVDGFWILYYFVTGFDHAAVAKAELC
jgi:hypothetical protein